MKICALHVGQWQSPSLGLSHFAGPGALRDVRLPAADQTALAEPYAIRAIELLMRARELGYFKKGENRADLNEEAEWKELQKRADFKKFWSEIGNQQQQFTLGFVRTHVETFPLWYPWCPKLDFLVDTTLHPYSAPPTSRARNRRVGGSLRRSYPASAF